MVDIDDFKQVNDSQGHDKGDQLLCEIATLLQRHSRSTDLIARWGGEEFILLLAHTDLHSARTVAEKIRVAICEHSFTTGKHTASLGIAAHQQNEPLETTINRADRAMYQAKATGKNKVAEFSPQPA
jgi:diguanylate cyclase (GGDEF)-like protein